MKSYQKEEKHFDERITTHIQRSNFSVQGSKDKPKFIKRDVES